MSQNPEELYSRTNYLSDVPYLIDNQIYEYDIRKANLNSLKAAGVLSDFDYQKYLNMPKIFREILIGKMISLDHSVYDKIHDGISEAKRIFMMQNNIDNSNVLRIANDSIYTYGIKEVSNFICTINDTPMEFIEKNKFSSFIKLNSVLIFYNQGVNNWVIDVKGISEDKLVYHQKFLSFICEIFQCLETSQYKIAFKEFNDFYNKYVNLKLPIEYYREFDSASLYEIKYHDGYKLDDPNSIPLNSIDTDYNLYLLRIIYSMITSCAKI